MKDYTTNDYKPLNRAIQQELFASRINNFSKVFFVLLVSLSLILIIFLIFNFANQLGSKDSQVISELRKKDEAVNQIVIDTEKSINAMEEWTVFNKVYLQDGRWVVTGSTYTRESQPTPIRQYCYIDEEKSIDLAMVKEGILLCQPGSEELLDLTRASCQIENIKELLTNPTKPCI